MCKVWSVAKWSGPGLLARGGAAIFQAEMAALDWTTEQIKRGYGTYSDWVLEGMGTLSPEEHLALDLGEGLFVQGVMELGTAGLAHGAPLAFRGARAALGAAKNAYLSRGIPTNVRAALRTMNSPAGYEESLRAYRHFHIKGLGSSTYEGPMTTVYRAQFEATPSLTSQGSRIGGVDYAADVAKRMGGPGEDVSAWYESAHRGVYRQSPYLSTAGDAPDFALHHLGPDLPPHPGVRFMGELGEDTIMAYKRGAGFLYEAEVPVGLTPGRADWAELFQKTPFRHYESYVEVPVFHEITPGMIRDVTPVEPTTYFTPISP